MDQQRSDDEFDRIERTAQLEKDRNMITQYVEHLGFYRKRVEDNRYQLGRLDERLER